MKVDIPPPFGINASLWSGLSSTRKATLFFLPRSQILAEIAVIQAAIDEKARKVDEARIKKEGKRVRQLEAKSTGTRFQKRLAEKQKRKEESKARRVAINTTRKKRKRKPQAPKPEKKPALHAPVGGTYSEFLRSDYWQHVRYLVFKRDGRKCTVCGALKFLHCHHKTYVHHRMEHKHLEDLATLCAECHAKEHGR